MVEWVVLQLLSYSPINWLLFVGIALAASYFLGWIGVVVGLFVIAFTVLLLDIGYAMTHEYMDMDIVFTMAVMVRAVLINSVLLPVSALGLFLRRRRRKLHAHPVADQPDQEPSGQ